MSTGLLIASFVCFVLACFPLDGRLVPAGLALYVLSLLITKF